MAYRRSQADSGVKFGPYAKSDSARRTAAAIIVVVGLIALIFGWLPGLVALVVATSFLWRLEHHFFFGRHGTDDDASSEETDTR
jgi:hypothetical protein